MTGEKGKDIGTKSVTGLYYDLMYTKEEAKEQSSQEIQQNLCLGNPCALSMCGNGTEHSKYYLI